MAAFITALFSAFSGAGAASAGAAAAGAASAGAAAAGAAASTATVSAPGLLGSIASGLGNLSWQSIASGAFTAIGALQSLASGQMQASAQRAAAMEQSVLAQIELTRGEQRAHDIRRSLFETVAGQRVAYLSSGIDISAGTPERARTEAIREAERQIDITRDNARLRSLGRRQQRRQLLAEADASMASGVGGALAGIGGLLERRIARG